VALALVQLLSGSKSPASPSGCPPPLTYNPKGARAVMVSSVLLALLEWQLNSVTFPKLFPRQKSSVETPGSFQSFLCFCGGCLQGAALAYGQDVFSRGNKAYSRSCGLLNFNFLGRILRTRGWRETHVSWEKIRRLHTTPKSLQCFVLMVYQRRSPEEISFLLPPLFMAPMQAASTVHLPAKPEKL